MPKQIEKAFTCPHCNHKYSTDNSLRAHLSRKHKAQQQVLMAKKKLMNKTCRGCRMTLSRSNNRKVHEKNCTAFLIVYGVAAKYDQDVLRARTIAESTKVPYPKQHLNELQKKFLADDLMELALEDMKESKYKNSLLRLLDQTSNEAFVIKDRTKENFRQLLKGILKNKNEAGDGVEDLFKWQDFKEEDSRIRKAIAIRADVIVMDPPWDIKLKLKYQVAEDGLLSCIPFEKLQENGFVLMWIVDGVQEKVIEKMKQKGYQCKGEIIWVKVSEHGFTVKGNGVQIRKSGEKCLIFAKGKYESIRVTHRSDNVIIAKVRGESIKPDAIYDRIDTMFPTAHVLEIFGRPWSLRTNVVTIGNQVY